MIIFTENDNEMSYNGEHINREETNSLSFTNENGDTIVLEFSTRKDRDDAIDSIKEAYIEDEDTLYLDNVERFSEE